METTRFRFCCRACGHSVVLELGPATENTQAVTWYCGCCGTPETADLGASLIAIGSNLAPSPDEWLNPRAAVVAEASHRRRAERDAKEREEQRRRPATPMPDSFALPLCCEACNQMLIVDVGRPLAESRPVTWQCPHCLATATEDLGAEILGVRPDAPNPSSPHWDINHKAAHAVHRSRMRRTLKTIRDIDESANLD